MFVLEAKWIGRLIKEFKGAKILNIGSSTSHFRSVQQPWINKYIFDKICELDLKVTHADIKVEQGVDIKINLLDSFDIEKLRYNFEVVICSNVLEHVVSVEEGSKNLERLCKKGDYIVVTGPSKYPYHPDPIDNLFRPTKQEILNLFENCELVKFKKIRNSNKFFATTDKGLITKNFVFIASILYDIFVAKISISDIKMKYLLRVEAYVVVLKKL